MRPHVFIKLTNVNENVVTNVEEEKTVVIKKEKKTTTKTEIPIENNPVEENLKQHE